MTQWSRFSDEELIDIIKSQAGTEAGRQATDALLDRYKEVVRSKARTYFLIGADRDDVIQEGMIGLYKAVIDFQPEKAASFRTFALMCIQRQIVSAVRVSLRLKHSPLNQYISLDRTVSDEEGKETTLMEMLPDAVGMSPEEILIDKDSHAQMKEEVLRLLSPMEKRVLQLFLDGQDYIEIAESLGKKPKSIDNALQRIKHKIMEYIA